MGRGPTWSPPFFASAIDWGLYECTAFSGRRNVRSMNTSSLLILEPPYQMARRLHDVSPDLGSVALLDALERRPSTNDVKAQMDVAPWCPLCILADGDSGMRSTRRLPRTCVVFGLADADGASAILRAVAARPRPTPSDMVEWLVRRTRASTLSRTLADLFTRPALRRNEVSFLPYTVREQLRLLGDWGALEWQRAAILADLASDRTSVNRVISADEPNAAETRRWIHELLGLSEREFHQRFGWEWVLEASLRRSGFFERKGKVVRALHPYRGVASSPDVGGDGIRVVGFGGRGRRAGPRSWCRGAVVRAGHAGWPAPWRGRAPAGGRSGRRVG